MGRKNSLFRLAAALLLIGLTVGFGGCHRGGANEAPTPAEAEITEKMLAAYGELQDYQMAMRLTLHPDTIADEETMVLESEISFKKPGKYREEIKAGALSGQITVTNGRSMWVYTPQINEVMLLEDVSQGEIITEMGDLRNEMLTTVVRETELAAARSVKSRVNLDSRPAYQLEITPREEDWLYGDGPAQVWIDAGDFLPRRVVSFDLDHRPVMEVDFRALKVNTGIADDRFDFVAPPGVHVVNVNDLALEEPGGNYSYREFSDLAAATQAAGFDACTPGYLPSGFARDNIALESDTVLTFSYSSGEQFVALSESREEIPLSYDYEKKTKLAAGEADTYRDGDVTVFAWQKNGIYLVLVGNIPDGELTRIANSLK